MKVSMALTVLVGLMFLNSAIGLRTAPLNRRSLHTSEARTGAARLLESTPAPATNATAVKPTPRTAAHGVKAGNATASNNTGTGARIGLNKWETLADNPTYPPIAVVDTADTAGKRRKLLHTRSLLDTNGCTQAELQRAQLGFDMECLQPYNNRWYDNDWRRRFFVRPGRNFG